MYVSYKENKRLFIKIRRVSYCWKMCVNLYLIELKGGDVWLGFVSMYVYVIKIMSRIWLWNLIYLYLVKCNVIFDKVWLGRLIVI